MSMTGLNLRMVLQTDRRRLPKILKKRKRRSKIKIKILRKSAINIRVRMILKKSYNRGSSIKIYKIIRVNKRKISRWMTEPIEKVLKELEKLKNPKILL